MMFIHQLTFKICGKITGPWNIGQGDLICYAVNRGVIQNQYSKYHNPWNSLQAIRQNRWSMKYDHNDLDLITLNVDVINMSDAHPSLSCLYKQSATYYFIEALIHEKGFKICQNQWSIKIGSRWPWPYYTECWCDKHVWFPSFFNKRLFV